jgi:thiaminase (transcriptional activator TenA)
MNYTEELWRSTQAIYAAIVAHPFIRGLTDGSLSRAAFQFYVIQDAHYLRHFAQCLSIAAAKAPSDDWLVTFNQHASAAILVERALHDSFFAEFGLTASQVWSTPLAPTNLAYTRYLLATAYTQPFHEVLAALLPCYWVYWEVGKELKKLGSSDPLYQRWIDTYTSEEFGNSVQQVLGLTDTIAHALSAEQRATMCGHFITTTRYEWMFWQMGYSEECWPV